jgi:ribonucleoside-diphosphate reductase beta chain
MSYLYYKAINWDETEDRFDQTTWEKLTNNFWLDTRIPLTQDQKNWQNLTWPMQQQIGNMLAAAALCAAFQSEVGTPALRSGRRTQQEEAVLNITTFMKSVHAKSCTTVFRALSNSQKAAGFFQWADKNRCLQTKINRLNQLYQSADPLKRRFGFLIAETFLLASQYYSILNQPVLQQVNKMIANLIINSLIFTNYIGYKFNQAFNELDSRQQADLKEWAKNETDFFFKNEVKFTQENYPQSQQNAVIDFISYQVSSLYQLLNWQSSLSQPSTNPVIQQFSQLVAKVNQAPQVAAVVDPDASEAMQDSDYDF